MRGFDLCFRLGLDIGIDRESDVIGLINRRRFRFWLRRRLSVFQLQAIHTIEDAVELALNSLVGTYFGGAPGDEVECAIKALLGGVRMASLIVVLPRLILALDV